MCGVTRNDGEQEVLEGILLAEPPESKVLLALASGGCVTLGALALCAFVHVDPAGETLMNISLNSHHSLPNKQS